MYNKICNNSTQLWLLLSKMGIFLYLVTWPGNCWKAVFVFDHIQCLKMHRYRGLCWVFSLLHMIQEVLCSFLF